MFDRNSVSVSSLHITLEEATIFRSIGLPANRISNISHNLTATYRHTPAYRQSICYCNIVWLQQGVRFRSSLYIRCSTKWQNLQFPMKSIIGWSTSLTSTHTVRTTDENYLYTMSAITASIIQGSSIGPPSYVVNTGDLKPITPGNQMVKFADDT